MTKRERATQPRATIIDRVGFIFSLSFAYGVTQFVSESLDDGWGNHNILEEMSEGGISAFIGATAALIIYRFLINKTNIRYNKTEECLFVLAGAFSAYATMSLIGSWLHSELGVTDVKWGPFKH